MSSMGLTGFEAARDGCDVSAIGARSGSWRRPVAGRTGSGLAQERVDPPMATAGESHVGGRERPTGKRGCTVRGKPHAVE